MQIFEFALILIPVRLFDSGPVFDSAMGSPHRLRNQNDREIAEDLPGTAFAPPTDKPPTAGGHIIMESAAIVLGFAALGGIAMALMRFLGSPRPPTWLALGHGAIAATGLVILIVTAFTTTIPTMAQVALGVFCLAAAGGITMFAGFHLREKPLPIILVAGHAVIALTGLVILFISLDWPRGP